MHNQQAIEKKPKGGRPRNAEPPKFLHLMLKRELYERIRAQADADGLELLPWIRFACTQELRRRQRESATS